MTKSIEDHNNEEVSKVDELRRRLKNDAMPKEMYDDSAMFRRFLRARNLNVDAAEVMLRNHLAWRKRFNVENISSWNPPQVLKEYFALNVLGFEKDGTPNVLLNGDLDFKGALKSAEKLDINKFVVQFVEGLLAKMKEVKKTIPNACQQWNLIIDFEGFSFLCATHKPSLQIMLQVVSLYDSNYPERLKAAYVVNGSLALTIIWALIKPILSGATVEKVKLFGKDDWQDTLQKAIDPELLPAFLGGKFTDPDGDPSCRKTLVLGGKIPQKYYKFKTGPCPQDKEDLKKLTVSRRSKLSVKIVVTKAESNVEWEFELKNRDIEFSLVYLGQRCSNTEVAEEVVPSQRIETNLEAETGMYTCSKPGIYALVFDNTYSWLHHKEIFYKVEVLDPQKAKSIL